MVYAALDIHKKVFQAAVLDGESGELVQERLAARCEALANWATRWQGKLEAVALEATTGWRWVWRELSARGFDVRLCDPGQTRPSRLEAAAEDRPAGRRLARTALGKRDAADLLASARRHPVSA
jgi:transposase